MRVLVVEDNLALAASLEQGLRELSYEVDATPLGRAAVEAAARGEVGVMVLDLGLPDVDGIEVLREIRGNGSHLPILVLTARDAVASRVEALDAGADDYLLKPFAFVELVARLRALGRRAAAPTWEPQAIGGLVLGDDHSCTVARRRIALSPRQHALLAYLVQRRGEIVPRTDLLRDVFGYVFDPGTNLVDVHLTHLRRKLGNGPVRIETVRGVGVRLEIDP